MTSTPDQDPDMTASTCGVVCPADRALIEFPLTRRLGELCGFWSRSTDDALYLVSDLVLLGQSVQGRTVYAAMSLLRANGEMGALRLAGRLLAAVEREIVQGNPRALPEDLVRRRPNQAVHLCAYVIEPFSKLRCRNRGIFNVTGRPGCYCDLHARRVSKAKEWTAELAARKAARRKVE
jgi:hypothetical protein